MRILFSPVVLFAVALGCLGIALAAAERGAASWQFGPEYVRRLVLWRHPDPVDRLRFPLRPIAAPATAEPILPDPGGEPVVREAFARLRGPAWAGPGLEQELARSGTTSFLVMRGGRLSFAAYLNGSGKRTPQNSFSIAKSMVGFLVGIAIEDGTLPPLDTPAERVLPEVPGLRGSGVTLRHLLDMQSGFHLDPGVRHRLLGLLTLPWHDGMRMHFAPDLAAVAAAVRPEVPPGTRFQYDDRNPMLLGMALRRATGETASHFLEGRLWQPMGAACPAEWILDSEEHGLEKLESGIGACAEDFLRLGALVLRGGCRADGRRVLPASWIEALGRPGPGEVQGEVPGYGLFWWSLPTPEGPPDLYAHGIFGQVLFVSRARQMVLLRMGDREGGVDWPLLLRDLAWALPPVEAAPENCPPG